MTHIRCILVEPESEGNIGAIARLIQNFDIDEYLIVNPQCEIEEVARNHAVHAQETLKTARVVDELEYAIMELDSLIGTTGIRGHDENLYRNPTPIDTVARDLPSETRIGIMFGREGTGLTNEELGRCDYVTTIPTSPDYPVMNLSHAAAVTFYELFVNTDAGKTRDGTSSTREKRAVLENLFKDATESLDWRLSRQEKALRALRNVLGRSHITDRETDLLLGWFRDVRDHIGTNTNKK